MSKNLYKYIPHDTNFTSAWEGNLKQAGNGASRRISKTQKYSRNNYCETFKSAHSAEKYPKRFSQKLETAFFKLEASENFAWEIFFEKSI